MRSLFHVAIHHLSWRLSLCLRLLIQAWHNLLMQKEPTPNLASLRNEIEKGFKVPISSRSVEDIIRSKVEEFKKR